MTHVLRENIKPASRLHKKEIVEAVTIVECPAMVVIGVTGYIHTPRGLKKIKTLWAQHLDESVIRRFYKRYRGKNNYKAFKKYQDSNHWQKERDNVISLLKRKADVIRVVVHPKMSDMSLSQIKAHVLETQVNGGDISSKVDWAFEHFEKEVRVGDVLTESEFVDVIGVTKGKGYEGVTKRYGVTTLPRKTHRGIRKIGCIGAWHPARVSWTVARSGQEGYHHRTEANKRIYRIGRSAREANDNATTEADATIKNITPLGGFPHYGPVLNDYVMLKGNTVGLRKRPLQLRLALKPRNMTDETRAVNLKFIDTSSKIGHGRFQTAEEKVNYFGQRKTQRSRKVLNRNLDKQAANQ
jgi:large subunit ribosomal protein L3e